MVHFWRIALLFLQLYFITTAKWLRVLQSVREMSGNFTVLKSGHRTKAVPHFKDQGVNLLLGEPL